MTFAHDAEHLVWNAGDPQTEPGRWPMRRDGTGHGYRRRHRGKFYCHTWHQATNDLGQCRGCLSPQRTILGWVIPHTPAPPQFHWCPYCPEPLPEPSYTNAGHPWCGGDDQDPMDDYDPAWDA